MSAGHYENFPVASLLLPRHLRPAVLAIYRFARAADDIADEGDAPPSERLAGLHAFERQLDAIAAGERVAEPLFSALAQAIARHRLPMQPMRDLLSAFRQDVTTRRYACYSHLLDYCRRSANPIGRLLLRVYDADAPANRDRSDAVCTALQLINFWQDVAVDWSRDRLYLPQEDLVRFGVVEAQIGERRCDERWRALMLFQTRRARTLLESGRSLAGAWPWRLRLELQGVLAGGHRILDAIDAVEGDVFRHRPHLAGVDWLIVASHAVLPPRRHREAASVGAA